MNPNAEDRTQEEIAKDKNKMTKNIEKILTASCFTTPIDKAIIAQVTDFLDKSTHFLFNDLLIKKLNSSNSRYAFKAQLLNFLSSIFPIEFYVYFDTISFQNSLATDSRKELKRYQKNKKRLNNVVFKNLKKIRKHKNQIKQRKSLRSKLHRFRQKLANNSKTKYIEKCKETKIFDRNKTDNVYHYIQATCQEELSPLQNSKKILRLINYTLTIFIKWVNKMDL